MMGNRTKFFRRIAKHIVCILHIPLRRKMEIMMRDNEQYRESLRLLLASIGLKDGVMVEIGSYRGESAEVFLGTGRLKRLYCVDPWKGFYDVDDGAAFTDMRKVEADFDRRHAADARVVKCKGAIDDFVERFKGIPVDVVYIDGNHTYEGVRHDIEVVQRLIKPRLAIAGHDFTPTRPGLREAVLELLGEPDKVFADTSWLKLCRKEWSK